jgi:hypothetical protein
MIGVERLQAALRIISATNSVANGMGALSVNLIAPSDSGKTQLMLSVLPPGARVMNDVTTHTLLRVMKEPKPPNYLVIPDLNIVVSHKPAVAELTMAMLLALMGEGVTELNPGLETAVKINMGRMKKTGLRIAVMTGMTPEMFYSRRGRWRGTGLLRRLVPINYTYKPSTQKQIQDAIQSGSDTLEYSHHKALTVRKRIVDIPEGLDQTIRLLSEDVIEQLAWKHAAKPGGTRVIVQAHHFPFTPHKVLRQMARASAVLNNRSIVAAADIDAVLNVSSFMRYDRPEAI